MRAKMKNRLLFLCLLVIASYAAAAVEDINCFDYYKFGTAVSFGSLMTEKASYAPGDVVEVSYSLLCQTDVPIVDGAVWAQVFYQDAADGEQMIDEFQVSEDISMQYGDELPGEFTWKLPSGAKSGDYSVKTYLIVGDYFNLAGLTILPYGPPGVPGDLTYFKVMPQGQVSRIFFSKNATTVDGGIYEFAAPAPIRFSGRHEIKTKIVNEGPAKDVRVRIEAYEWANVAGKPVDVMDKSVSLGSGAQMDIVYSLPELMSATYEIVLTASTDDGEKSLMKIRVPVAGVKGRFIYAGFDSFPLVKDSAVSMFMCYSGSSDYTTFFNATGTATVEDVYGNVVYSERYGPFEVMPSPPQGKKFSFNMPRNLTKAVLKLEMYDDSGALQDKIALDYDITKFTDTPADYEISLSKDVYSTDQDISYIVKCFDVYENPLKCQVQVSLTDEPGEVFYDYSEENVSGSMQGALLSPGKAGRYKVEARYLDSGETAEASFTMIDAKPDEAAKAVQTQPVQSDAMYPDKEIKHNAFGRTGSSLQNLIVIAGGFIVVVGMFLAAKSMGQKKKKK